MECSPTPWDTSFVITNESFVITNNPSPESVEPINENTQQSLQDSVLVKKILEQPSNLGEAGPTPYDTSDYEYEYEITTECIIDESDTTTDKNDLKTAAYTFPQCAAHQFKKRKVYKKKNKRRPILPGKELYSDYDE